VGARQVTGAHLRLQVAKVTNAQSVTGGRLHPISDCTWNERTVTWSTQPLIDGPALVTLGAVAQGQTVDFDVSSIITGDGAYCFALDTLSTDSVLYSSREATAGKPQVAVTAVCPCAPAVTTTTTRAPGVTTTTTLPPTAPAAGRVVAAVPIGQVPAFDVPSAIPGDGTYSFAIDTVSTDSALYKPREGTGTRPALALQVVP